MSLEELPYGDPADPLTALLEKIETPGSFYVEGRLAVPVPRIEIADLEAPLSFPVPETQAAAVAARGAPAPYGRGEETLHDDEVRRTRQLAPDQVRLGGNWPTGFHEILERVVRGLGLEPEAVRAEFYKLLVYEPGGFFKPHRDTEKHGDMFGTLVIVLPSRHGGGELVVEHGGESVALDLADGDISELRFAAFYADCLHEVKPVRDGHRLCLVFNLLHAGERGAAPTAPVRGQQIEAIAGHLRERTVAAEASSKIVWLLEHQYSPDGLRPDALKGADDARFRVLRAASERAEQDLHLGLVHLYETGAAEESYDDWYGGRGRRRRRDDDASEDFTVVEAYDWGFSIKEWRRLDGGPVAFGELPIDKGELLPAGCLDGEPPDKQRYMEATGNEGASYERSYHRAALVLWPTSQAGPVLLRGGAQNALPPLGDLIERDQSDDAESLAARILDIWPSRGPSHQYRFLPPRSDNEAAELLELLVELDRPEPLLGFLTQLLPHEFTASMVESLPRAIQVVTDDEAAEAALLATVTSRFDPEANGLVDLARRLAAMPDRRLIAGRFLEKLIHTLNRFKVVPPPPPHYSRFYGGYTDPGTPLPLDAAHIADLVLAVEEAGADPAKLLRALGRRPEAIPPDTLLLPATESLAGAKSAHAPVLWNLTAELLLARSEKPPTEPSDWAQPAEWECNCQDCSALKKFARDPEAAELRLARKKQLRQHLHNIIDANQLDMTHETERRGRPYTLVCSKTRTVHQRLVEQHQSDQEHFETLRGLARELDGIDPALQTRLAAVEENRQAG